MIAIIAVAGAVQASSWDFGVKLGLNQTTLTKPANSFYILEINGSNGFTGGFFAEKHLQSFSGLYFDITYSNRKTGTLEDCSGLYSFPDYLDDNLQDRIPFINVTHFINLSTALKLYPPAMYKAMPFVYGGPVFSVLLNGHKETAYPINFVESRSIKTPKAAIGYAIGCGLEFNIKGRKSSLDIRLARTLNSLAYFQEPERPQPAIPFLPTDYDLKYKNSVISATLGVSLFRL